MEELTFRFKTEFGDALGYGYLNHDASNAKQHGNIKEMTHSDSVPASNSQIYVAENDHVNARELENERTDTLGLKQGFQQKSPAITDEELYQRQKLDFVDALGYDDVS